MHSLLVLIRKSTTPPLLLLISTNATDPLLNTDKYIGYSRPHRLHYYRWGQRPCLRYSYLLAQRPHLLHYTETHTECHTSFIITDEHKGHASFHDILKWACAPIMCIFYSHFSTVCYINTSALEGNWILCSLWNKCALHQTHINDKNTLVPGFKLQYYGLPMQINAIIYYFILIYVHHIQSNWALIFAGVPKLLHRTANTFYGLWSTMVIHSEPKSAGVTSKLNTLLLAITVERNRSRCMRPRLRFNLHSGGRQRDRGRRCVFTLDL